MLDVSSALRSSCELGTWLLDGPKLAVHCRTWNIGTHHDCKVSPFRKVARRTTPDVTLVRDMSCYPSHMLCRAVVSGPKLHDGRRASTLDGERARFVALARYSAFCSDGVDEYALLSHLSGTRCSWIGLMREHEVGAVVTGKASFGDYAGIDAASGIETRGGR